MGYLAQRHAIRTGETVSPSIALLTADDISQDPSEYGNRELWARAIIVLGFRQALGRNPTLLEAQFAQAVARGESGYGTGWKDDGVGSNNWGAVQAGRPPCDPSTSFIYTDTHEDGTKYESCFRRYDTPADGAAGFIKIMMKANVLAAANAGDITGVSGSMRANHYFELGLDKHIVALTRNLKAVTTALNEPMPSGGSSGGGAMILVGLGVVVAVVVAMKAGKRAGLMAAAIPG
jgi:hypothetical protein